MAVELASRVPIVDPDGCHLMLLLLRYWKLMCGVIAVGILRNKRLHSVATNLFHSRKNAPIIILEHGRTIHTMSADGLLKRKSANPFGTGPDHPTTLPIFNLMG